MLNLPFGDTIRWFEGVVENRKDPLMLGRVQVRVYGIHTDDLTKIPEADLHWMQIMHPVTSAATSGVSSTPSLVEGSHVIGYFRDGINSQDGIVLGSIGGIPQESRSINKGFYDHRTASELAPTNAPGKPKTVVYKDTTGVEITEDTRPPYPKYIDEPDTSRLVRNEKADVDTVLQHKKSSRASQTGIPTALGGAFDEPAPPYNAKYPYNKVTETESGHVIELDDSPGNERVHVAHRSGSFVEMHKNGDVVTKSAKNQYNIVHASDYQHVEGTKWVTVDKGEKLFVNSSAEGGQHLEIEVGSGGNLVIHVDNGDLNLVVNGNVYQNVTDDYIVKVGGLFKVTANRIELN